MRQEFYDKRADQLRDFEGSGMSISQIAEVLCLSRATVVKYSKLYELDFLSSRTTEETERRISLIIEASAAGKTREAAAKDIGISVFVLGKIARDNDIKFVHAGSGCADAERAEAMAAMYRGGKTLQEIGTLYGLSRERVRQLIKKQTGITAKDGGQHMAAERKRSERQASRDRQAFDKYGCSREDYESLIELGRGLMAAGCSWERTPCGAWQGQRNNALRRGLGWTIKLWDWWQIWQQSGKWEQRGRGKDSYVMCRFRDDGPYELGNVYIATASHNIKMQPNNPNRKSHPNHAEHLAKLRAERLKAGISRRVASKRKYHDLPIGVTKSNNRFMAQICIDGRNTYLGSFGSADEAHAAYLNKLSELEARIAA